MNKQRIIVITLVILLIMTTVAVYAGVPENQYPFFENAKYSSWPIYQFYATGKYKTAENINAECYMAGWVYYTPKSGIVPAPKDE